MVELFESGKVPTRPILLLSTDGAADESPRYPKVCSLYHEHFETVFSRFILDLLPLYKSLCTKVCVLITEHTMTPATELCRDAIQETWP